MPGALAGAGEVKDLQVAGNCRIGFLQEREGIVAVTVLITQAEGMRAGVGREHQAGQVVVDFAGQLAAVLVGVEVAKDCTELPCAYRLVVGQLQQLLVIDVLQFGVPQADRGIFLVELVVAADEVEAITLS